MQIRTAAESDLEKILICHRAAFPRTLSSRLGSQVSYKMLQWYVNHEKRFLIWLDDGAKCVGYAGGSVVDGSQVHGSASSMIQHSFAEMAVALLMRPWLWFHPELVSRYRLIFKNIVFKLTRYKIPMRDRQNFELIEPYVGLVVIGVHPLHQGKGLGSTLLKAFEEKSRAIGHRKMSLSVLADNKQAIKSYEKNGWVITRRAGNSVKMYKRVDDLG